LLNLHEAAIFWLHAAWETNSQVRNWIAAGMPEDVPAQFFAARHLNVGAAHIVAGHLEVGPSDALQKVLAVYAPDVAEQLSHVLTGRLSFLDGFASELQRIKASPPEVAEGLARTLDQQVKDLEAAAEDLGTMIRGLRPMSGH
jgi:hypothetical protein